MTYKKLGSTSVSAIGFGGMRFLPEEYLDGNYETCAKIVLRALELGINYVDTAPGYCDDHSEKIIGHALSQLPKQSVADGNGGKMDLPIVSTKCGLWLATTADQARARIEKSLKRLKIDKINIYNLWCIKSMDDYREMTKPGGMYDGIRKAQEEGLIDRICCTAHVDGDDIARIIADGKVESVTLGYNALNFAYRRSGVVACHQKGIGVVTMNPLGGGVIPEHPELFKGLFAEDDSVVVGALKFLVGQPEVTVALPGLSSIAQVEEAVRAAENVSPVTETVLSSMAQKLSSSLNSLCTGCGYCDECPQNIPIPKYLDAYNEYMLAGEKQEVIGVRLRDHWSITADLAKDCTSCGQCEALCTQKLPIIERLGVIAG